MKKRSGQDPTHAVQWEIHFSWIYSFLFCSPGMDFYEASLHAMLEHQTCLECLYYISFCQIFDVTLMTLIVFVENAACLFISRLWWFTQTQWILPDVRCCSIVQQVMQLNETEDFSRRGYSFTHKEPNIYISHIHLGNSIQHWRIEPAISLSIHRYLHSVLGLID